MTGLIIYGDNGRVQFDSNSPVVTFVRKGTHDTSTQASTLPGGARGSVLTVPSVGMPILALRPQSVGLRCGIYGTSEANGQRSYNIVTVGTGLIDWYQFDATPAYQEGVGLRVYSADGQMLYHTASKPLRVISVGGTISESEPGGRTYALIQGSFAGVRRWVMDANDPQERYVLYFYNYAIGRPADGSIDTKLSVFARYSNPPTSNPPADQALGPINFMCVDVTGY